MCVQADFTDIFAGGTYSAFCGVRRNDSALGAETRTPGPYLRQIRNVKSVYKLNTGDGATKGVGRRGLKAQYEI